MTAGSDATPLIPRKTLPLEVLPVSVLTHFSGK